MAMAPLPDPTSVLGRRVAAAAVDVAVVFGPGVAITATQVEYADAARRKELGTEPNAATFCDHYINTHNGSCFNVDGTVYYAEATAAPFLTMLGLTILVFVIVQGLTGWTVGKLALGLRTVREDGGVPGIGRALVRSLFLFIDWLPCVPLVGFITSLTTTGHRRVGDMAAKTFVVRKDAAGSPVSVPGLTAPPVYGGYSPAPGVPPPPGAPNAPGWPGSPAIPPPPPYPAPQAVAGPQWDEARGTYIQWDPAQSAWMQWDDTAKVWIPIR